MRAPLRAGQGILGAVKAALLVILLLVPLSGCMNTPAAEYTLLPYGHDDGPLEIAGKTLVNLPVWTAEVGLVTAFTAAWIWVQMGAPHIH